VHDVSSGGVIHQAELEPGGLSILECSSGRLDRIERSRHANVVAVAFAPHGSSSVVIGTPHGHVHRLDLVEPDTPT
jgi:hypothetical protein